MSDYSNNGAIPPGLEPDSTTSNSIVNQKLTAKTAFVLPLYATNPDPENATVAATLCVGMIIYNTTDQIAYVYNGESWDAICVNCG